MDRDTVRPVVLALLAVVAIGVAAATLDSAVQTDSSGGLGFGAESPEVGAPGGGQPSFELGNRSGATGGAALNLPCYPALDEWWAIAAILGAFGLGGYVAYRRLGGIGVVAYAGPVGIPLLFVHAMLTACTQPLPETRSALFEQGNVSLLPDGGSGAPGSGTGTITDPSVLLLAGLAVALLAAVALLFVSSSGDDPEPDEEFVESDTEDVQAVGRAAGEAADRIEDATDVDNEVYRAWREMTDHLDVANPASSTPAEFAGAAVEAGMAREDVDRLTSVFEEVRYGGESPTDEREEEALDALRRIEREYADRGPDLDRERDSDRGPDADGEPDSGDGPDADRGGDAE